MYLSHRRTQLRGIYFRLGLINWYATSLEWLELQEGKNEKLKNISNKGKGWSCYFRFAHFIRNFQAQFPCRGAAFELSPAFKRRAKLKSRSAAGESYFQKPP